MPMASIYGNDTVAFKEMSREKNYADYQEESKCYVAPSIELVSHNDVVEF